MYMRVCVCVGLQVPPPYDAGVVPSMESWDEAFLPKAMREERRKFKARAQIDDFESLNAANCRTIK